MKRHGLWSRLARTAVAALLAAAFVVVLAYAFPFIDILRALLSLVARIWPPLVWVAWFLAVPVLVVAYFATTAIIYALMESVLARRPTAGPGEDTKRPQPDGDDRGLARPDT